MNDLIVYGICFFFLSDCVKNKQKNKCVKKINRKANV